MAKELNCEILETLIKWGDNAPKYDPRSWNADRSQMSKGITLTRTELMILKNELGGIEV